METVKARKQGNAVMVTLASTFGISEGQEFYIFKEEDGTISLIPKIDDFFKDATVNEFVDDDLDDFAKNYVPTGREQHV